MAVATKTTIPTSLETFDEEGYLAANPDIVSAIRSGALKNGRQHFEAVGHLEGRHSVQTARLAIARKQKNAKFERFLTPGYTRMANGGFNCLPDELAKMAGVEATDAVSDHDYDPTVKSYFEENTDKLFLDAGAGYRHIYYDHIVNLEIAPYATTDVLAVLERIPFKDNTFDGVVSSAVLEHVRDPFSAAKEIIRVTKPGGKLFILVPFLQPYHGYPHHYYNMTKSGLRNLFGDSVKVESHTVPFYYHPAWVLSWMTNSWARGLSPAAKDQFEKLTVKELMNFSMESMSQNFVAELSEEKQFEMASGTFLIAEKH